MRAQKSPALPNDVAEAGYGGRWMLSGQPACTPRVGASGRSVPSWAFIGTVSKNLKRAGVTVRHGAPSHPATTQRIVELRDQGLTWAEVAVQVGMTVSRSRTAGQWAWCIVSRPIPGLEPAR
jgi:hypothetical protein